MPVENRTSRFDDVDMTYSSATGLAQNVTLFATPFYTKTAVDVTRALRAGQHRRGSA